MNDKTLQIGKNIYTGWKSVSISKKIDALASSFSLSLVDNVSKPGQNAWPITAGMPAMIKDKNDALITGFIDNMKVQVSKGEKRINVEGRDNTGDLVDSSASINAPSEFINQSLFQITQKLVEPFGIPVTDLAKDQTPFPRFSVEPGESVFESLERAARKIGVLFRSDGRGTLVIEKIGQKRSDTPLIEGKNIISVSATYDLSNSFSHYFSRGQAHDDSEEAATEIEGVAKDSSIGRFRPLVLISDGDLTTNKAQGVAAWEATVRASRALKVNVVTQGWRQSSGSLWDVNNLTSIHSPSIGVSSEMLIVGVDFSYTKEGGSLTRLELSRPDAYLPKPEVSKPNLEALNGD